MLPNELACRAFLPTMRTLLFLAAILTTSIAGADELVEVSGDVVDEQGQPVAGVQVVAYTIPTAQATVSGEDGKFSIAISLEQVSLVLVARDKSGDRQAFGIFQAYKPRRVRLGLRPAIEVTAEVRDAKGKPVADAAVFADSNGRIIADERTDAAGHALLKIPSDAPLRFIAALKDEAGLDYVLFQRPGESPSLGATLAGDKPESLRFELHSARPIRVRLVDPQDRPIAGADVSVNVVALPGKGGNLNSGQKFLTVTDENGMATFRSIPNDSILSSGFSVRCKTHAAQEIRVVDPQTVTGDVVIRMLPFVKLSGIATFDEVGGKPAAGADISIRGEGFQIAGFRGKTTAGPDGRFSIDVHPNQFLAYQASAGRMMSSVETLIVREKLPDKELRIVLRPATRVFGKLTSGKNREPLGDEFLGFNQRLPTTYNQLLKEDLLPNPQSRQHLPSPSLGLKTKTNMQGEFEIYLPRGKFTARGLDRDITISDETELKIEPNIKVIEKVELSGRVVLKEKPDQGAAKAKVVGMGWGSLGGNFGVTADGDGRFTTKCAPGIIFVHAASEDGSRLGLIRVDEGKTDFDIPLSPAASVRGRLVDKKSGGPMARMQLDCFAHVASEGTLHASILSRPFGVSVVANEHGEFTIKGLVKDWKYVLRVRQNASNHQVVGLFVASKSASTLQLGDYEVAPPGEVSEGWSEPTPEERLAKALDKPGTPAQRLADGLRDARIGDQRLLVVATTRTSRTGREFYRDELTFREAMNNHWPLAFDTTKPDDAKVWQEQLARWKVAWPDEKQTTFLVVEPDGRLVTSRTADELSTEGKLSEEKLAEFLESHAPTMPDAQTLLADAFAQARREKKRVMVRETGPYCAPCVLLARYLDANRELLAKDYVFVKLDPRFANYVEALEPLRPKSGGIPWTVILDAEGKPLISSDGPEGNFGFPSSAVGIKHFERMLRETAVNLSDAEIVKLLAALKR